MLTVYAKDQPVQVIDGAPVMPSSASGSGSITVYAPGLSVEVRDVVASNPAPVVLGSRALNMSKIVQFYDWSPAGRYTRYIKNMFWSKTSSDNDIQITANDHTGVDYKLSGTYTLTARFEGAGPTVSLATFVAPAGTTRKTFDNVNLSALQDGWHLFDIVVPDDATVVPFWMHVGAVQPGDWAPFQTGSFGITHEDGPTVRWGLAPPTITPATYALKPRPTVEHFSNAALPATLHRRNLSPCINGDPPYLRTLDNGAKTCLNSHGYAFATITQKRPPVVLRDGPYGVGTLSAPMHLEWGTANIPEIGGFVDNVYFCDPWSFGKIRYCGANPASNSGTIVRLAGYRDTPNGLELVGDWSSIPVERRGFNELWGLAWDTRTQATDLTADPIPAERNLRPHVTGIVAFLPDSNNNRICRVEFDPRSHATPAKVTEFIVGMADPWDVVYSNGLLYVSERKLNRISAWDATTGAFVRTVVQGTTGYAYIGDDHRPYRTATVDQIRLQPCICPEGLFIQDGWLYFGSISAAQVKRIHLTTGVLESACVWTPVSKSEYCKIALSDGTFGPRGTVFISTWEVNKMGAPWAFLPGGAPWAYISVGSNSANSGVGGKWDGIGYSTACGVARGRLIYGGADYGVVEITKARAGDVTIDEDLYAQGKQDYEYAGYRQTHGIDGYGQWGQALPWGLSAACDYYLTAQGHKP
jgi:hypothetical protein